MAVTIREIAKRLNLSVGAVSRALDGYPDISAETRQKVVEMAREMGYVPNHAARQLRKKKTDTLGYIMPVHSPRFADSFFSEFIEGLGDETTDKGYDLLISTAPPGSEKEKTIYQQWVQGRKVDGLVLNRIFENDWRIQYLKSQQMPFSSLENDGSCESGLCVVVDSVNGMIQLVDHVVQRGFRRLAFIGGSHGLHIHNGRLTGFQKGLERYNLSLSPEFLMEGDMTSVGGYHAARRLLSNPDPPDAVLCINDETAFGALRAVSETGRVVGKDVAVAGFDGVRDARYSNPPLTTLDQPVYEIARMLVRMLVEEINANQSGTGVVQRQVILQPVLLARASTGE
jgi:LacI family transcriptional regulator